MSTQNEKLETIDIVLFVLLIVSLVGYGILTYVPPHERNNPVVKKVNINKHQKILRDKDQNKTEYQGRDRLMPAGIRSPVDRVFDPIGEMIDPYGLF